MREDIENNEEVVEKEKGANKLIKQVLFMILYIAGVFLAAYLIITYIGQRTIVIGDSMNETLHDGDNLIVDKITYRFRDPKRFEVVVFPPKCEPDTLYIKRIIGLPNETVRIDSEGNIYINDEILYEDYGRDIIIDPGMAEETIVLGADEYFVLGDNRNYSKDSRDPGVGIITLERIEGRAIFRVFPFNKFGKIKNGNLDIDEE